MVETNSSCIFSEVQLLFVYMGLSDCKNLYHPIRQVLPIIKMHKILSYFLYHKMN